jgi:hypothetical protein
MIKTVAIDFDGVIHDYKRGEPVTLRPWQEEAVRALPGWDERQIGAVLRPQGHGAGTSVVLYTAGRYARARAKCRPLRDDPIRERAGQR